MVVISVNIYDTEPINQYNKFGMNITIIDDMEINGKILMFSLRNPCIIMNPIKRETIIEMVRKPGDTPKHIEMPKVVETYDLSNYEEYDLLIFEIDLPFDN